MNNLGLTGKEFADQRRKHMPPVVKVGPITAIHRSGRERWAERAAGEECAQVWSKRTCQVWGG